MKSEVIVYEPIRQLKYDKKWPLEYIKEVENLKRIIPNYVAAKYFHIGSTSIPNMVSRGTIDILITCLLLEIFTIVNILTSNDYILLRNSSNLRHYIFVKKIDNKIKFMIHVLPKNSKSAYEFLKFKKILIENPKIRYDYSLFKRSLTYKNISLNQYSALKYQYINKILGK